MYRPRIIPVLLLKNNSLVKSVKFKDHKYIGDALNAAHLFNQLQVDELVLLDIDATKEKRSIDKSLVKTIGEETRMPFSVGGGISKLKDIEILLNAGAERVIVNSYAGLHTNFIQEAALAFGSTSLIICIDVRKNIFGRYEVCINNGKKKISFAPLEYALMAQDKGAGEIILQSIDDDGSMKGYNTKLLKSIVDKLKIPVTALGGAGSLVDMQQASREAKVNGLAGGSMFVYQGKRKGVLINYPDKASIKKMQWN